MMKVVSKVLLPIFVIGLILFCACSTNNPPPPPPPPPPPQQLQATVSTMFNAYGSGSRVTIRFWINQPANLTLTNTMPNGATVTYFQNVLYDAGESTYSGTANPPFGQRTVTLRAIATNGQTVTASTTYTVGSGAMFMME